jgi:hypothetical protein
MEESTRRAIGSWIIVAISLVAAVWVATSLSGTSRLAEGIGLTFPNIDLVAAGNLVWEMGIQAWGYFVAAGIIVWEAINEIYLWIAEAINEIYLRIAEIMQSLINYLLEVLP